MPKKVIKMHRRKLTVGSGTKISIRVKHDGDELDFSSITRMRLVFFGSKAEADTNDDSSLITWNSDGVVTFNVSSLGFNGVKKAQLIAYDPQHSSGQPVIDHRTNGFMFEFI